MATRKYIDCREYPEGGCSVAISADSDEELLDTAVQHGITAHGMDDTPETREQMKSMIKNGSPKK